MLQVCYTQQGAAAILAAATILLITGSPLTYLPSNHPPSYLHLQVKSYFLLLDLGNEELTMQAFDDLLDSATWVAATSCLSPTVLSST